MTASPLLSYAVRVERKVYVEWTYEPPVGAEPRSVRLTRMQRNVLESLCDGKSNALIGVDWGIKEDTVKSHVKELLKRTGARDRLQLVVWHAVTKELHVEVSHTIGWDHELGEADAQELLSRA